jgi:dephospho-CoA kinase
MLAELGAAIIDADVLAREVVEPGRPAFAKIVARFGAEVVDPATGALDRKKLGAIVFADDAARKDLNAIVHPEVAALSAQRMQEAGARGAPLCVYDVPLLYENGLDRMLPTVVVVSASPAIQRARVRARDGLSDVEIEQRIAAQMPLAEKVSRADFVVENDGDLSDTRRQVEALFLELTGGTT